MMNYTKLQRSVMIWFILAIIFLVDNVFAQQAVLTWVYKDDPQGPAADFLIERKLGPLASTNPWQQIAAFKTGTVYTDKTISANVEYCYRVGAKNSIGTTWSSNPSVACATAGVASPSGPTALKLDMSQATLSVNWVAPTNPKPTPKDWVALYRLSDPDAKHISGPVCGGKSCWEYTKGAVSGTFIVTPPGPGTYDIRYLLNDGFTSAQKSRNAVIVP